MISNCPVNCTCKLFYQIECSSIKPDLISQIFNLLYINHIFCKKFIFIYPILIQHNQSETKYSSIHQHLFNGLFKFRYLYLFSLRIRSINKKSSYFLQNFVYIEMIDTIVSIILLRILRRWKKYWINTTILVCCLVWKFSENIENCKPDQSFISSCSDLIASINLRAALWITGIICLLWNVTSFLFRFLVNQKTKKMNLLFIGFNISDMCTGIYL